MGEPEVNRGHYFVRRSGGGTDLARFRRLGDGSAVLEEKLAREAGLNVTTYGHAPGAWQEALAGLSRAGYVGLAWAIRSGLLTKDEADSLVAGMG
jgi:hypothetical protein